MGTNQDFKTKQKEQQQHEEKKEEDDDNDNIKLNNNNNDTTNYKKNLRTMGVAQLCPECYRPFYCSEDHFDEVQRLQYLSEVCSFWVFMLILWVPLIIAFFIPALFSYIFQLILG